MSDKFMANSDKQYIFDISNPNMTTTVTALPGVKKLTIEQNDTFNIEDEALWKRLNSIFDIVESMGIEIIVLDSCKSLDQPKCQQIIATRLPNTKITEVMIMDSYGDNEICSHTIWFTTRLEVFYTDRIAAYMDNECVLAINLIQQMKTNYKTIVVVMQEPSKDELYYKKILKYNLRNQRARRKCLTAIASILVLKKRPGNLISQLPKDLIPLITKPIYDTFGTKVWV
jgi:hypothetical protein